MERVPLVNLKLKRESISRYPPLPPRKSIPVQSSLCQGRTIQDPSRPIRPNLRCSKKEIQAPRQPSSPSAPTKPLSDYAYSTSGPTAVSDYIQTPNDSFQGYPSQPFTITHMSFPPDMPKHRHPDTFSSQLPYSSSLVSIPTKAPHLPFAPIVVPNPHHQAYAMASAVNMLEEMASIGSDINHFNLRCGRNSFAGR